MTLTVLRDTVPPTVVRALNIGTTSVEVVYSKAVDPASATNTANYVFTNGLSISVASLGADNVTVTLATAPLVYGSNYTLVINGVRDRASIPKHHRRQHDRHFYGPALCQPGHWQPADPRRHQLRQQQHHGHRFWQRYRRR